MDKILFENPPIGRLWGIIDTILHIQRILTHIYFLQCTLSPSPFQFLPQEVSTQTLEEHPTEEQSHLTLGSAPVSRTSPTNSGEILQQLVQVLTLQGWCRQDNCPLYDPPMESSLGVQSILKVTSSHSTFIGTYKI